MYSLNVDLQEAESLYSIFNVLTYQCEICPRLSSVGGTSRLWCCHEWCGRRQTTHARSRLSPGSVGPVREHLVQRVSNKVVYDGCSVRLTFDGLQGSTAVIVAEKEEEITSFPPGPCDNTYKCCLMIQEHKLQHSLLWPSQLQRTFY